MIHDNKTLLDEMQEPAVCNKSSQHGEPGAEWPSFMKPLLALPGTVSVGF